MMRAIARTIIYASHITRRQQRYLCRFVTKEHLQRPIRNAAAFIHSRTDFSQIQNAGSSSPSSSINFQKENSEKKSIAQAFVPDWSIHELFMTMGVGLWDDRPEGAQFIVGYVDTAAHVEPVIKNELPTVLAVAGGNGCHDDILPILKPLAEQGFRIIIPYPVGTPPTRGFADCDEDQFSHRLGERSAFLLDFIATLGVDRCDIAVGHGHGCFPITALISNYPIFNSVAFVCPIPGHSPSRLIRPQWWTAKFIKCSDSFIYHPLAYLMQLAFYGGRCSSILPTKYNLKSTTALMKILLGVNYDMLPSLASVIEARRVPRLYVYCDSDSAIDATESAEYAEMFGITSDLTDIYDEDGTLVSKGGDAKNGYARAVRLAHNSHYPTRSEKWCDVIISELLKLQDATIKKL